MLNQVVSRALTRPGAARARTTNARGRVHARRQFQTAVANRLTRQARGGRDQRVSAIPDRHRFRGGPESACALIQHGRHHDILRDDCRLDVRVTLHTVVRSHDGP